MSSVLIATLCGLIAALCYGVGDWLTPRSKRKLTPWQINLVVNLCGALIGLLILLLVPPAHWHGTNLWPKAFLYSAFVSVGYLFFVRALTIGSIGVVVPLSSTYPLITLSLSIVISNYFYSAHQVIAMIVIVLGAVFLAYEKNHNDLPLKQLYQANIWTLAAVVIWGVGFFWLNPLFHQMNWQVLLLMLDGSGVLVALAVISVISKRQALHEIRYALVDMTVWTAGFLLAGGTAVLYFGGGKTGNIIIPAVITSLSPLLSSALEVAVDRKRLGILKRVGAVLAVGGVVLLNLA